MSIYLEFFLFLSIGLGCGFISGLIGISGGIILVPVLDFVFPWLGFEHTLSMHMAVASAISISVLTSLSSMRAHHRLGNIDWSIVRRMWPGLVLGATIGPLIVERLSAGSLRLIFSSCLLLMAVNMLRGRTVQLTNALPSNPGLSIIALLLAFLATIIGSGGGIFMVPLFALCGMAVIRAVGTSAALGLPLTLTAALMFTVVVGAETSNLPAYTVGYVYGPAFITIGIGSILAAPLGAYCTQRLSNDALKRVFAVTIICLAIILLAK